MKVELISWTNDPVGTVAKAASACYDSTPDRKIVSQCLASGHYSVIEHMNFTFKIEGVSRALTHQLVRHRIASYSQRSQRYCSEEGTKMVVPPSIEQNNVARDIYNKIMWRIEEAYQDLQALEIPNEDARFVLPNACETKLIMTMDARNLIHFFEERCCMRAQWEVRDVANQMLDLVLDVAPNIFSKAGPACAFGKCKEGKMSCGQVQEPREKQKVKKL